MRDRALEGKETQNDRSMVDGCLSECSSIRSVETLKTERRPIERLGEQEKRAPDESREPSD
mgnify:CR=1 FL=1